MRPLIGEVGERRWRALYMGGVDTERRVPGRTCYGLQRERTTSCTVCHHDTSPLATFIHASNSLSHPNPELLLPTLENYNNSTEAARFSQNSFECEVCLTSIKGARCIMLSCSHVFCRSCLADFWGLCIREGDVARVGCPDPGCVKAHNEATEEEVRRVVTEEELLRWKWLRMKQALEKGGGL